MLKSCQYCGRDVYKRQVKRLKKHFGIDIDTVCEELADQIDHL